MSRMLKACTVAVAAGAVVALAACGDRLTVPNFQSPTVGSITADPVAALPLLATGVMRDDRGNLPGYVLGVGILGREAYNYSPTEGRNTTGWLTSDVNNNTSFGGGALWSGPFFTIRDAFNTLTVVDSSGGVFSDAQKNAMRGLMHTEVALSLLYLINTRDKLGAPVEVYADPTKLAPFVSRDSVYNYIVGLLNQANTELGNGGTSFPFTLPSGFTGFTSPANFTKFNRALAARTWAYKASLGVGGCTAKSATCYQQVLTALSGSFMDPAGALTTGVFNVYSAAAGDVANGNSNQATTNIVAHAKSDSGVQVNALGVKDTRFTTKILKLATPKAPPGSVTGSVPTNFDFAQPALRTDPIGIIRNEELILLRAEARYYTGDQAGALADINLIRTKAGGLDPLTGFASESAFVDELLYERRWSLLFEGHRWIDMRRFGRLNQLTLDSPSHVVVNNLPVPQGECLERASVEATLKAPGC